MSFASEGLAEPEKILMRSGFIVRTGFGAAIGHLWNVASEHGSMRIGIAYG